MRELHGVLRTESDVNLKRYALLFDKLHTVENRSNEEVRQMLGGPDLIPEYNFLIERGILREITPSVGQYAVSAALRAMQQGIAVSDVYMRTLAASLSNTSDADTVPICQKELPVTNAEAGPDPNSSIADVVRVALEAFPTPDDNCAWEDILNFKDEMRDKQWAFRRFLKTLSTRDQTEAEIRDDLEWTLSEYRKAMQIHKIKASQSFVDVFVITPLEIIENLVTFNWSKIAKGALSIRKRKVELVEAEMKAPGRECAYVFDARRRFIVDTG